MSPPRRTHPRPSVVVVGLQAGGVIRGTTTPGVEVEALNLSVAPGARICPSESVVIARADRDGRFSGTLPMRVGDLVRVRARSPNGALGAPLTFRARGLPGEARPMIVATFRIGLRDLGDGRVRVFNLSPKRPIAEPGAVLWLSNTRTGDRVRVVMNARGTIPGRSRIPGRAGDTLRVEAGDASPRACGALLTPAAERPLVRDRAAVVQPSGEHQKLGFVPTLRRFHEPLFDPRPRPQDVFQSELGDCYVASAVAAVAQMRPRCLERAIVRTGAHTYRVRFNVRDGRTGAYVTREVVVTADLYVRPSGPLLYGSSAGLAEPPSLWWPVLEKAFARRKGSYRQLGRGGASHHVLEALLGRPPRHFYTDAWSAAAVWGELTRAMDERLPVVVGTFPKRTARRYRRTGLHPDHAYAVTSCREERGTRLVGLRNPWAEDVARPGVVRRKGCFDLDFTRFMELIEVTSTVR